MAGINKVILLGRLGKDPEVRTFQNGGGGRGRPTDDLDDAIPFAPEWR